jgi:hypothetical protein
MHPTNKLLVLLRTLLLKLHASLSHLFLNTTKYESHHEKRNQSMQWKTTICHETHYMMSYLLPVERLSIEPPSNGEAKELSGKPLWDGSGDGGLKCDIIK